MDILSIPYFTASGQGVGREYGDSKQATSSDFIKLQYASDFTSLAHFIQEENYIFKQIY